MNYITKDFNELDIYLNDIRKFKRMEPEEEALLWDRIQADEDEQARTKIVESYLAVPIFVARRYLNKGLSFSDLIQEGNIGLIQAVKAYRPSRGAKFITFAYIIIRQHIYAALSEKAKFIHIPLKAQKAAWKAVQTNTMTKETQEVYSVFKVESLDEKKEDDQSFLSVTEDPTWSEGFDSIDTQRHAYRIKRDLLKFLKSSELRPSDVQLACLIYGLDGEQEHSLTDAGEIVGWTRQNVSVRNKVIYKKVKSFKRDWVVYST